MGLFEHFPYTNFHELNLGWFLDKFKALLAEWGIYQPIFEEIRDEAEAAAADAAEALAAAETAQGAAETALAQANTAITTANTAVTEAQTARTGAETAQAAAETALADAVTAKNAAVAAQTAAEAAQNAAEDAQTAAENAQYAAELAEGNAAHSANQAEDAADAAETAQAAAETALADAVTAKNAALAAQTAAEDAADRAEAAVAMDAELRLAWDDTNSEIDATQVPVIVSGTYLDLVSKLQAGTPVKIRVYSNSDITTGTPALRRIHQHIYPVTGVSLTTSLITIALYYWTGNPSSTSKSYTILWTSSGITIAPVV